jgi:hypothetical protein
VRTAVLALLAALLAGCAPAPAVQADPELSPPVVTHARETALPSPSPSPADTPPPIPCDPLLEAYCLLDADLPLDRPARPPASDNIDPTYLFGTTQFGERQPHYGVEFVNSTGTPVYAAAGGRVVVAGDDQAALYSPWPNFYGNLVILEHDIHGQVVYTLYAHLSRLEVVPGEWVPAGTRIGEVGASGSALGSHLHFEVRLGENRYDAARNPALWLKPRLLAGGQPGGLLAGGVIDLAGQPVQAHLRIEHYPQRDAPLAWAYDVETYHPEMPPGEYAWENFALGDLAPGWYRITFLYGGRFYEHWTPVEAGRLTLVVVRLD